MEEISALSFNPANIPKTPNSAMTIYTGIPWDQDYYNVRLFENEEERRGYLASAGHAPRQFNQVTYIRETGAIRLPLSKEILDRYNYCHFDNAIAYNGINRVYFAFIVRREWVNYNVCDIWVKLDYFQTFFLDFTTGAFPVAQGLVEREHTASDLYGEHRVDEGLGWGEYIQDKNIQLINMPKFTAMCVMMLSEIDTLVSAGMIGQIVKIDYGHAYTGLYLYASYDGSAIDRVVDLLSKAGKAGSIVAMYMYPIQMWTEQTDFTGLIDEDASSKLFIDIANFADGPIDGYTPKNKKCYLYPFRALSLQIEGTAAKVFRYEDFEATESPRGLINNAFKFYLPFTPGGSWLITPQKYLGIADNLEEALTGTNYPLCGWVTDVYKQWLAQNQYGMNLQRQITADEINMNYRQMQDASRYNLGIGNIWNMLGSLTGTSLNGTPQSIIGSLMAPTNAFVQYAGGTHKYNEITEPQAFEKSQFQYEKYVKNQQIENYKASIVPDSAHGNTATANSAYAAGYNSIIARPKCLRKESIQQADNYFSLYGYKVMRLKTPNLKTRKAWNYVKMCVANITDDFMPDVKDTFKRVLERGVTFWHTNDMFNYDLDNSPTPQAREGV